MADTAAGWLCYGKDVQIFQKNFAGEDQIVVNLFADMLNIMIRHFVKYSQYKSMRTRGRDL